MEQNITTSLPYHVGIIADGNRRWAKKRHLPTALGHAAGLRQIKKIVEHLRDRGVKAVTVYAFSTENWKRSDEEVGALMKLFTQFIGKYFKKFYEEGGRLRVIGDPSVLPAPLQKALDDAIKASKNNTAFTMQIALNYGGRDEIVRAIKKLITKKIPANKITDESISKVLDTNEVADPDLIIRTSGEQRLSNFMLWQSAYSELYFAPELLPDFSLKKVDEVLAWYASRDRRIGK